MYEMLLWTINLGEILRLFAEFLSKTCLDTWYIVHSSISYINCTLKWNWKPFQEVHFCKHKGMELFLDRILGWFSTIFYHCVFQFLILTWTASSRMNVWIILDCLAAAWHQGIRTALQQPYFKPSWAERLTYVRSPAAPTGLEHF